MTVSRPETAVAVWDCAEDGKAPAPTIKADIATPV
jgi:hypothetical protein